MSGSRDSFWNAGKAAVIVNVLSFLDEQDKRRFCDLSTFLSSREIKGSVCTHRFTEKAARKYAVEAAFCHGAQESQI